MKARYQYRIYPTTNQRLAIARLFGCCRVVWNDALNYCNEKRQKGEKKPDGKELSKRLTQLKKTEEKEWLGEVSSVPLQQVLRDLDQAYSNFFKSCKGDKIADTRKDFLHKLSTRVIRENQTIALEDLNTSGMIKNRKLARAISDLGWRTFRDMLTAKADKYGRDLRIIDRWEPTSQRCSCCGEKGGKKELSTREWTCLFCGSVHDRDINASQNILNVAVGHIETQNGRVRKRKTAVKVAVSVEASTTFKAVQLTLF